MKVLHPLISKLTDGTRTKRYPKGQIIVYQGDLPNEVLVLANGYIKICDIDQQGNEKVLHILSAGALVPFGFFSGGEEAVRFFYSALTDCEVYVFSFEEMQRQVKESNELLLFLVKWFSLEVHELLFRLSSMGKSNAKMKVIAALKFLASRTAQKNSGGWYRVDFPVNHQLLADMTGLTRESAATIMKDLTIRGYTRNPRQNILEIYLDKMDP